MSSVVYMECSECAVPVCDDGPLRAVLLVPCQHVLHAGCAEFSRRRARARCPACRVAVQRVVPLFPSGGGACGDDTRVAAAYRPVHAAQRSAAAQLRALHSARERVAGLSVQCAALHSRRAAAQHEAERIAAAMECAEGPGGVCSPKGPGGSALCVDGMTATELELFIAQSAPALARLERDVRHVRRAVQRRRAKVSEARAKCRSAQAARAEREESEEKQQQEQEEEKEEVEREGTEGRAGSSGSVQCAGSESPSRWEKEESRERGDSGNRWDSGRERESGMERWERAKRKRPPPPPPFVDVDESGGSDGGDDVVIVEQRPAPRGSSGSGNHQHQHHQQQQQQQQQQQEENEEDEDDEDEGIALYVPQLVAPAKRTVNFSRLLPRREDRLWQSSLDEVL